MQLRSSNYSPLKLQKLLTSPVSKTRLFTTTAHRLGLSSDHPVTDVAVLGGGITGLTSAYYLTQAFPYAKISLFEGSDRFGGWVRSSKVDVGGKHVFFEHGPRTLRNSPESIVTSDLVRSPSRREVKKTCLDRAPGCPSRPFRRCPRHIEGFPSSDEPIHLLP